MMTSYFNLLKYAATGQASPDMTYYDRMRASTLMGGATVQTLTGQPPLSFPSDGSPITVWSMKGNGSQQETPSPQNIIMPTFCGKLVGADWTIPITCAGQTVPVYLGQTQTVRKIRKLVLTGEENIIMPTTSSFQLFGVIQWGSESAFCSHYTQISFNDATSAKSTGFATRPATDGADRFRICDKSITTIEDFKAYLAAQYANGNPVTIWYVLATPQTGIVNEPLCKIGDYADELRSEDAGVTIPTSKGSNTLTVDTPIQPSEMTITFKG